MMMQEDAHLTHSLELATRVLFAVMKLNIAKDDEISNPATAEQFGLDVYKVEHVGSNEDDSDTASSEEFNWVGNSSQERQETAREWQRNSNEPKIRRLSCPSNHILPGKPENRRYSCTEIKSGGKGVPVDKDSGLSNWKGRHDLQLVHNESHSSTPRADLSNRGGIDQDLNLPFAKMALQMPNSRLMFQHGAGLFKDRQESVLPQNVPLSQRYASYAKFDFAQDRSVLKIIEDSVNKKPARALPPINNLTNNLENLDGGQIDPNTRRILQSRKYESSFIWQSSGDDLLAGEDHFKRSKQSLRGRKVKKTMKASDMKLKSQTMDKKCSLLAVEERNVKEFPRNDVQILQLNGISKRIRQGVAKTKQRQSERKGGYAKANGKKIEPLELKVAKMQNGIGGRSILESSNNNNEIKSIMKERKREATPRKKDPQRKVSFNQKVIRIHVITRPIGSKESGPARTPVDEKA